MNNYPHINVQRQIKMKPQMQEIFIEYKLILPSLWTRSYFVSTAGNVSSETIKR